MAKPKRTEKLRLNRLLFFTQAMLSSVESPTVWTNTLFDIQNFLIICKSHNGRFFKNQWLYSAFRELSTGHFFNKPPVSYSQLVA